MTLKLWDNGNDFVIAESPSDALVLWIKHTGEDPVDYTADEWEAWDDDRVFTFVNEDDDTKTAKTSREWCAEHGKGYFASRNY